MKRIPWYRSAWWLLLAGCCGWSSGAGQVIDPDNCWTCYDTRLHFVAGAAIDQAAAVAFKKPWQRVLVTAAIGAAYEAGQEAIARDAGVRGRGFGFGLKDLAADVLGALAREWVWSTIKKRRR